MEKKWLMNRSTKLNDNLQESHYLSSNIAAIIFSTSAATFPYWKYYYQLGSNSLMRNDIDFFFPFCAHWRNDCYYGYYIINVVF